LIAGYCYLQLAWSSKYILEVKLKLGFRIWWAYRCSFDTTVLKLLEGWRRGLWSLYELKVALGAINTLRVGRHCAL
jgi:hypothetical protein